MNNYILFFLYALSSVIAGFSFGLCIYIIEWVAQSGAEMPFAFAFFSSMGYAILGLPNTSILFGVDITIEEYWQAMSKYKIFFLMILGGILAVICPPLIFLTIGEEFDIIRITGFFIMGFIHPLIAHLLIKAVVR